MARAQDDEVRLVAHLVASSGVSGRFADPVCRDGTTLAPSGFARPARALAEPHEPGPALVFDTGGLLAPHGVARYATEQEPDALAEMVTALGYRALALGSSDLAAPRDSTVRILGALRRRGIPTVATNLYCGPSARELCDVLVDGGDGISMHRVAEERIAFIALVGPGTLSRIAPERADGVRLAPLVESVSRATRAARERGATLVVASLNDGWDAQATTRALELVRGLDETSKPDILFAAGAGEHILFARPPSFQPAIVAAPPGGVAHLNVRRRGDLLDLLAQRVEPDPVAPPAEAVTRFIDTIGASYCNEWGRELAGGSLSEPLDQRGMVELVANIMRAETNAEVALLNRGAIYYDFQPSDPGSLTASDVYLALQYDEPLMTAMVDGRWLEALGRRLNDEPRLVAPGLAKEEAAVTVNGRALEPRGRYRVVTIRFLATAGDDLLEPGPEWVPVPDATLRSVVIDALDQPSETDPREALPDPLDIAVWTVGADGDLGFAATSVNDRGVEFEDAQLQQNTTATASLTATLRADGIGRLWGWDNLFSLQYRTTRTGDSFDEALDITSLRSSARWRGLRVLREEPYVPEPFLETYVETELTEREESDFRHFLVRPVLGLQFTLTPHLTLKLMGGFEIEVFAPGRDFLPGAGFQLVLKPFTLMRADAREVKLEWAIDYFASDFGDRNRQTLRLTVATTLAINRFLSLGVRVDMFGVTEDGAVDMEGMAVHDRFGIAASTTVFLKATWLGRLLVP